MQIYTNYQPAVAIRVLAPYIGAIHMSDNDGKNDLHLPLGAGRLSFRDSLTALMRIDYCSGLVIEVMNVEDAIRSRSHLTNLIQEVLEEGSQGAGEIQTEKINGG
jgi:sugar phosphate isomerase/epimerase